MKLSASKCFWFSFPRETNLKCKQCLTATVPLREDVEAISAFDGEIVCEPPNNNLSKFKGTLNWNGKRWDYKLGTAKGMIPNWNQLKVGFPNLEQEQQKVGFQIEEQQNVGFKIENSKKWDSK